MDIQTVKKVAKIAHLALTEKEELQYLKELNNILESFKIIDEVDTTDVESSLHPIKLKNHEREDKIESSISQESALSQTKQKKDGFFIGPRTV